MNDFSSNPVNNLPTPSSGGGSEDQSVASLWQENQLYETAEYLEKLFNYSNVPIIVWDATYRITKFNHAFENLTGRTFLEVAGHSLDILFPEQTKTESLKQIYQTAQGERLQTTEIRIQHTNGTIKNVLWNSVNIYDPGNNNLIATIAQGQDVTDLKTAERKLHDQNLLYNDLVNTQPVGIYRIRATTKKDWDNFAIETDAGSFYTIDFISDGFCKLLNIEAQDFIKNPGIIFEMVYPDDKPEFLEKNVTAVKSLAKFSWEGRMLIDSKIIWTHFESIPRTIEYGEVIFTGILYDITERKLSELKSQQFNQELELRVQQQTAKLMETIEQLETQSRVFVGRELRMIELKERIIELERQLGTKDSTAIPGDVFPSP